MSNSGSHRRKRDEKPEIDSAMLQPPPAFDPRKPLTLTNLTDSKPKPVQQPMPPPMIPPPVMMPSYAPFIPPMTYQAVPMPAPLPVPPIPTNTKPIPPPPFNLPALSSTISATTTTPSTLNPRASTPGGISMSFDEDGFEEMQEAMQFAEQLMSMGNDKSSEDKKEVSEAKAKTNDSKSPPPVNAPLEIGRAHV